MFVLLIVWNLTVHIWNVCQWYNFSVIFYQNLSMSFQVETCEPVDTLMCFHIILIEELIQKSLIFFLNVLVQVNHL